MLRKDTDDCKILREIILENKTGCTRINNEYNLVYIPKTIILILSV